ncbi:protein FAM177B [Bombina bombina]|uniref:protein FAM177B n=1 Tax=Bombina bombina TaxID=8345 RepID=UPI00235B15FD|nr:protein FAM177B [Bombina bombina]
MSEGDIVLKEVEDVEKKKLPRRIIHFVSGETLEEYSTEEEEDEEEQDKVDFYSVDTTAMTWGSYLQFWMLRIVTMAFFTCDFLGGRLASIFGLNLPKYQYVIDEYNRMQDEETEDEDGEDVTEIGEPSAVNEKIHLHMQSMEYGTIHPTQDGTLPDNVQMDTETQNSESVISGK